MTANNFFKRLVDLDFDDGMIKALKPDIGRSIFRKKY
jgi:hypothetical protein